MLHAIPCAWPSGATYPKLSSEGHWKTDNEVAVGMGMLSGGELSDNAGDGRRDVGRFTEEMRRLIDGRPVVMDKLTEGSPIPTEGKLIHGMLIEKLTEGSPVPIEGRLIDGLLSVGRAIDGIVGEGKLKEVGKEGKSEGKEPLKANEGKVRVGTTSVGRPGMRLVQLSV